MRSTKTAFVVGRGLVLSSLLFGLSSCATKSGEFIAKCHVERIAIGTLTIREDEKCTAPVELWKIFSGEEGIQPTDEYLDILRPGLVEEED